MNKALLTAGIAVLLSFTASAQLTRGKKLLGGSISGYTNKVDYGAGNKAKVNGISINPSLGFFTAENRAIGFNAGYNYSNSDGVKSTTYTVGAFYRRYLPLAKSLFLFGEGGLNLSAGNDESTASGLGKRETSRWGTNLYLTPGIAIAATPRFHIEATVNSLVEIGYSRSRTEYPQSSGTAEEKGRHFVMASNLSSNAPIGIGFRFLLGK